MLVADVTCRIFLHHRPSPTQFMPFCPSVFFLHPLLRLPGQAYKWAYKCHKPAALLWEWHKRANTSVLAVKGSHKLRFHREAPQQLLLIIHSSTHQKERVLATAEQLRGCREGISHAWRNPHRFVGHGDSPLSNSDRDSVQVGLKIIQLSSY